MEDTETNIVELYDIISGHLFDEGKQYEIT
jgi:hypothetical protein